jgi:hypothetical protein
VRCTYRVKFIARRVGQIVSRRPIAKQIKIKRDRPVSHTPQLPDFRQRSSLAFAQDDGEESLAVLELQFLS